MTRAHRHNGTTAGPIFIGGTGRSGTTLLCRLLGRHKDIHSFPLEMRFLVDPDGVMNLIDALTIRYSPTQAREALYRFERFLTVYLTTPNRAPYRGFDITRHIDRDFFLQRTNSFIGLLVDGEFEGADLPRAEERRSQRLLDGARFLMGLSQRDRSRRILKIVRYQPDRQKLMQLTAEFIDDLFMHAAAKYDKWYWCEKTPSNFLHFDFLRELFLEAALVHIMRDPRGVVHSMRAKPWAPSETAAVCDYIKSAYEKWFASKAMMDKNDDSYLEVRLEELTEQPHNTLKIVCDFCGISGSVDDALIEDVTPERVNAWRDLMSRQDREIVEEKLGAEIEKLGYRI